MATNSYAAIIPVIAPFAKGLQAPDVEGTADLLYAGQEWPGDSIALPRIWNTSAWLDASILARTSLIER